MAAETSLSLYRSQGERKSDSRRRTKKALSKNAQRMALGNSPTQFFLRDYSDSCNISPAGELRQ